MRRCVAGITIPSPARSVFRPDPGLLLLVTRMPLDPDGQPHVPGNMDVWTDPVREAHNSKHTHERSKKSVHANSSEQLIECSVCPFPLLRFDGDSSSLFVPQRD